MALSTTGKTATTTAAALLVAGDTNSPSVVLVTNEDATIHVRVGYNVADVSSTTGLRIRAASGPNPIPLDAGESLFVASESGTPTVSFARTRAVQRSS